MGFFLAIIVPNIKYNVYYGENAFDKYIYEYESRKSFI